MEGLPLASAQTEPTTQACAPTGNQTGDFLLCGMMPNQLSHTGQGGSYVWESQVSVSRPGITGKVRAGPVPSL